MALATSKLTSQGQISVPAEVRKRLGIGPGSVIEWTEQGNQVTVSKRGGDVTFALLNDKLFPDGARKTATVEEMDESIARGIREKFGWMRKSASKVPVKKGR